MGEAYKGLTIKIGADVSGLTSALAQVNKRASETQRSLRKVDNGLKGNPRSVELLGEKLSQIAQGATLASAKVRLMRSSLDGMRGTEVEKAVRSTANLALRAASAKDEYNRLNKEIAALRTNVMSAQGWSIQKITKTDPEEIDREIAKLARQNSEVAKQHRLLKSLKSSWESVNDEMRLMDGAQSFAKLERDLKLAESEAGRLAREFVQVREELLRVGSTPGLRNVNKELERAKAVSAEAEADMRKLDEALRLDPDSFDLLVKSLISARSQITATEAEVSQLEAKMKELKAAGASPGDKPMAQLAHEAQIAKSNVEGLRASLAKVDAELSAAKTEAADFSRNLDANGAKRAQARVSALERESAALSSQLKAAERAFDGAYMAKEFRQAETSLAALNAKLSNLRALSKGAKTDFAGLFYSVRTLGVGLTASLGGTMWQFVPSLVNQAETIDSAFRDMKKTVNGTEEQFQQLRDAAIDYSKVHVTSADTMLEIEAMAGQLGVATENLRGFSEVVSNLDIATDMDAEDIAIDLGKLQNVIGDLDEGNIDRFADALVRLGNNNAALESDIMNITTRFGGMASQVGMSADEILAWATAATATGVKAESAGSNMLKTLGFINSSVAGGGAALKIFSDVAGMSADEIRKKWGDGRGGTSEVFRSFIDTLSKMKSTDVDDTLQTIGITSVRQRQLIEGLTQSMGNMDDVLSMSRNAWNGVSDEWGNAGDAAYEAQQKSEGFSGALGIMRNNLASVSDQVGSDLLPYIQDATGAIQSFSDVYSNLSDSDKDFFFKLAAGLVAAGPGLTLLGSMGQGIVSISKAYGAANKRADKFIAKNVEAGKISKSLGAGLSKAASFAGIAAAAIVGVAAAIADAKRKADEFDSAVNTTAGDVLGKWGIDQKSISGSVSSLGDLRLANEKLAHSMVSTNSGIASSMTDAKSSIGMLDEYGKTVERISAKVQKKGITKLSGLSGKDQGALKNALSEINKTLGTGYKPIDIIAKGQADEAKKVNDEIQRSIELKQLSIQQDAVSSAYQDKYKEQMQAADNMASAQSKVNDALQKWSDLSTSNAPSPLVTQAQDEYTVATQELEKAQQMYDSAKGSADRYKEATEYIASAQSAGTKSLRFLISDNAQAFAQLSSSGTLEQFTSALKSVGVTYKWLTADQRENTEWLAQLASSYDGSTQSLVSGLDSLNIKYNEAAAGMEAAKQSISSSLSGLGSEASEKMSSAYGSVENFIKAAEDAGYKIDDLKSITPIQWDSILNAGDLGSKASGLSDQVRQSLDEAIKGGVDANVKVTADTSEADTKLDETGRKADELGQKTATPKVSADTSSFDAAAKGVEDSISRLDGKTATVTIRVNRVSSGAPSGVPGTDFQSAPEQSRPVALSAMAMQASRSMAALDSAYTSGRSAVDSAAYGVQSMASRDRIRYKAATSKPNNALDKESLDVLKAIARNTKGGKGIYLDGNRLVGGTVDRYDTTMARRERLAKRGVDV